MSDADALLEAVLADPDADLPRHLFADWCDDHGDPARADLVRVQLARAADPRSAALQVREHRLLTRHQADWLKPLRAKGEPLQNPSTHARFVRGFVEVVWMPAGVFLWKGERLFRRAPVRTLRVTRAQQGEVRELFASELVGRLRELDLTGRDGAEVAAAVAAAPADRLPAVLGLRNCRLTDAEAEVLLTADRGWRPAVLDVAVNPLGEATRDRLRGRFGTALREQAGFGPG
jgi:uncharacterized protein (TIGR02996 family)